MHTLRDKIKEVGLTEMVLRTCSTDSTRSNCPSCNSRLIRPISNHYVGLPAFCCYNCMRSFNMGDSGLIHVKEVKAGV